jgi:hypothetical protein
VTLAFLWSSCRPDHGQGFTAVQSSGPKTGVGRFEPHPDSSDLPACNFLAIGGSVESMTMERIIRMFAGSFILLSLVLAHFHSPNWLWLTAFVGFNLLQSSFTNFCPLEIILRKAGVGTGECCRAEKTNSSCCVK